MALDQTSAVLIAALGASAITGAITFGISAYAARKQRQRDEKRRDYERERDALARANLLSDQRNDRLREGYAAIVFAAETMHDVANDLQRLWTIEPREVRNKRYDDSLATATADLGQAAAQILLEEGGANLLDHYRALAISFGEYVQRAQHMEVTGEIEKRDEVLLLLTDVAEKSNDVLQLAREHLGTIQTRCPVIVALRRSQGPDLDVASS